MFPVLWNLRFSNRLDLLEMVNVVLQNANDPTHALEAYMY